MEGLDDSLVFFIQGFEIIVGLILLIGCQSIGDIDDIAPALRCQNRFTVVSVVIQQGFQIGFVRVGIRLGTDESAVESHADLLEDGMSNVVDEIGPVGVGCVISITFLDVPLYFEVTARQVHKIFLRVDLKIDRVDARGKRTHGDHAITDVADIRGGNPKEIQHGILDPHRSGHWDDRRHRRRLLLLFRAFLTQP